MQTRACAPRGAALRSATQCRRSAPSRGSARLRLPAALPRAARRTGRRSCGTWRARAGWTSAWTSGAWAACSTSPCTASRPSSGRAVSPRRTHVYCHCVPLMSWHILSSTRSNTCTSPRRSVAGRASSEAVPLCARSVTGARHAQDRQRARLRLCYQALCSEMCYSHAGSAALRKPSSVPALAPHRAAGQRTKLRHINAVTRAWCGHAGPE